jgi:D-arabinose 1-dehydrogenase-like Zn-dependent alcohol dehydrogenase
VQFANSLGFRTVAITRHRQGGALLKLGAHYFIDSATGDVTEKACKLFLIELVRGASGKLWRLAAMMDGRLRVVGMVLRRHSRTAL